MFHNPLMLIGIGAAVLPLILHLLARSRYRTLDWGAMMFLDGAGSQQNSSRLSQILLLLIRASMVGLLALALARPVLYSRWGSAAAGRSMAAVIVLDCSGSMAVEENGPTRFELARAAARQVLEGLRKGDEAGLVLIGTDDDRDVQLPPTADLSAIDAGLRAARPGRGSADVADGMQRAADLLERQSSGRREIYLIGDRQANSWRNVDEAFAARWRTRVSASSIGVSVLPVGSLSAENISVDAVELLNPPAIRGQPSEVEIRLRNFGSVSRAAVPLALSVGTAQIFETRVDLEAGASSSTRVPVKFAQAGSQVLSAAIKTTGFASDDVLEGVANVIDPVRVLIISGDEREGAFRSESDFSRLALAPHGSAAGSADLAQVDVVAAEHWSGAAVALSKNEEMPPPAATAPPPIETQIERYQVIILANLESISAEQARALGQFVYDGGGLLVAPGNLSRVEDYNALLYRNAAGLLPARLETPTAGDGSAATTVLGMDISHPVFRFLKGRPDPIPGATVGRYFPAHSIRPDARVLATFASGHPFLIVLAAGRGRVLLLTTALDADWSTLPLSNFYLPFVQSMVRFLAGGRAPDNTLAIGQPIEFTLDDASEERSASVYRPGSSVTLPLELLRSGKREARYTDTATSGRYRFVVKDKGKETTLHFIVQPSREESDLTPITDQRWQMLQRTLGLERVEENEQSIATTVSSARNGHELWSTGLALVLLLAVVEMTAARVWSRTAV